MMRLLLLCALVGAAYLYLQAPVSNPVQPLANLTMPAAPAALPASVEPLQAPVAETPKAPDPAPREAKPIARRASPIPTSPLPPALAALESPSAGLGPRPAAAPRLPVTEILPDGTARSAGGPTEQAPPLARIVPRGRPADPVPEPAPAPSAATTAPAVVPSPAAVLRPSQSDMFFKNAARILAETEIPK